MSQPRRPFKEVEKSRPDFDHAAQFTVTKTRSPSWNWGTGATDGGACLDKQHVEVDPNEPGRPAHNNYKLLISAIVPRPIGFIGTRNVDGNTQNLAPFSFTQVVNHDPPVFVIGFAGSNDKDTLRNLKATGECVINIISENFVEAANAASIDTPYGLSEWDVSGLTPAPCKDVNVSRVKESVFSVEGKLLEVKDFESRVHKGVKSGSMAIIEGVRFWIREDAYDQQQGTIDPAVLRPVYRLGGISYGRVTQAFELPRFKYEEKKSELPKM
ncbi:hypothetical protein AYO20_11363 [Fonsecaea nubica]|uniref:Flavin reductase like domain-containing protein n=1 Tax=Fonsecaea nubica TaxID=856822 RepID=A0A178BWL1_9EURO|nr:hypothetical protein AYO20_11363 [Fonsecaea nubica]OAL21426.1 hypothetical protein AYO20_11363 [Fonsecaea nubica]